MMPAGRPTDYSEELLTQTREYLENYKDLEHAIPSIEGLCKVINRARSTVYRWAEEEGKEEFKDTLEQIMEYQKFDLLNGGLKGEFNPAITKLALGNHGMSEKLQQEHSGPNGGPIQGTVTFVGINKK